MDPTALAPLASRYISVSDLPWKPTGHAGVEMKALLEDKESGLLTALFRWQPGAVLRHVARSPSGARVLGFFLKPNRFLA